ARGRGDRHALFGLNAQRHQARGQLGDALAGFPPGEGLPLLIGVRVLVCGTFGGGPDTVVEHLPDAAGTVVDNFELFGGGNGHGYLNWSSSLVDSRAMPRTL